MEPICALMIIQKCTSIQNKFQNFNIGYCVYQIYGKIITLMPRDNAFLMSMKSFDFLVDEQTRKVHRNSPPSSYTVPQLAYSPDARRFHIPGYA